METKNLAGLYDLPPLEWGPIEARLNDALTMAPGTGGPDRHSAWLATINADGSPHVTGLGALWVDDAFWFVTGERSRKGRNLARDPRCTMSLATHDYDLVVEGTASGSSIRRGGGHGRPVGGRGMARQRRRVGGRAHRGVQRPIGRTAALGGLPAHAPSGACRVDHRARWRDPLDLRRGLIQITGDPGSRPNRMRPVTS